MRPQLPALVSAKPDGSDRRVIVAARNGRLGRYAARRYERGRWPVRSAAAERHASFCSTLTARAIRICAAIDLTNGSMTT